MKTSKSSNLCSYKKFYILSTIIYAIACAWVMVAYCTEGQSGLVVCPSKLIYHIPCPGCGMTRATLLVIHGHWADAIRMNPNVVICMVGIIIFPILLVADMARGTTCLHQTYQKIEHLLHKRLVISLILLNNTIRLAIFSKRYLINTMKLVGATKWFIMRPFLGSSITQGILSGIIASALFLTAVYGLNEAVPELMSLAETMKIGIIVGGMVLGGILISLCFTFFAVNKFVNMKSNKIYLY